MTSAAGAPQMRRAAGGGLLTTLLPLGALLLASGKSGRPVIQEILDPDPPEDNELSTESDPFSVADLNGTFYMDVTPAEGVLPPALFPIPGVPTGAIRGVGDENPHLGEDEDDDLERGEWHNARFPSSLWVSLPILCWTRDSLIFVLRPLARNREFTAESWYEAAVSGVQELTCGSWFCKTEGGDRTLITPTRNSPPRVSYPSYDAWKATWIQGGYSHLPVRMRINDQLWAAGTDRLLLEHEAAHVSYTESMNLEFDGRLWGYLPESIGLTLSHRRFTGRYRTTRTRRCVRTENCGGGR